MRLFCFSVLFQFDLSFYVAVFCQSRFHCVFLLPFTIFSILWTVRSISKIEIKWTLKYTKDYGHLLFPLHLCGGTIVIVARIPPQ